MADYPFNISAFPNAAVAIDRLDQEIRASSIVTAVDWIDLVGQTCTVRFKAQLSGGDVVVLNGLVAAHTGAPLAQPPQPVVVSATADVHLTSPSNQTTGVPHVTLAGREGAETIYATHNLADPTTWYSCSIRVEDEQLTDSGNGLTWTSLHDTWIDMVSGRVMDDDGIRTESAHGWLVIVTVDDVVQQPREPLEEQGGDYTVDFEAGCITFASSKAGSVVQASYSYADGSTWILRPTVGKALDVEQAEAQFSGDVILTDTIKFAILGWAAVFAPELVAAQLLEPTDLVEIGSDLYKRVRQVVDNALGAYPAVPAIGGPTRGTTQPIHGFPFRYGTIRRLYAQYGMELHVSLVHDRPFGGEFATATFYCVAHDEADLA